MKRKRERKGLEESMEEFKRVGYVLIKNKLSEIDIKADQRSFLSSLKENSDEISQFEIENNNFSLNNCNVKFQDLIKKSFCSNQSEILHFYISLILQNNNDQLWISFEKILRSRLSLLMKILSLDSCIWLFMAFSSNIKRKQNMIGRKEHKDEIFASGTVHYQLLGQKIWKLRETEAEEFQQLTVNKGDLLLINTKQIYHSTIAVCDENSKFSISLAKDFTFDCNQNE